jgi:hypothetical protein
MKPLPNVRLLLLGLSIGIFSCSSSKYATTGTSEYDDLYFNNSDRYPVMTDGTTTVVQRADTDGGIGVGYDSKTLNPDYGLPQDAVVENEYAEDEYYVEDHDDQYMDKAIDDYLRNNSTARRYTNPRYYNGRVLGGRSVLVGPVPGRRARRSVLRPRPDQRAAHRQRHADPL